MCRGGKDGQIRRCPSHSDKGCVDNRNARRRELRAGKAQRETLVAELEQKKIKHVRGKDIDNAYYMGESFDREKFKILQDKEIEIFEGHIAGPLKPDHDVGLWTSPGSIHENGKVSTEWSKWCENEGSNCSDNNVSHVKTMPDAVILVIDNDEDLKRIYAQFPDSQGRTFSFKKMQEAGVDGIHLSQEGVNSISRDYGNEESNMRDMYGWDIESTFWMNNTFLQKGANLQVHGGNHRNDYDDDPWGEEDQKQLEEYYEAISYYENLKEGQNQDEPLRIDVHDPKMTKMLGRAMNYKKTSTVKARVTQGGEKVETVLADNTVETRNTAEVGSLIVTNPGNEEYIVDAEKFSQRYREAEEVGVHHAHGRVQALPNPTKHPITIVAPWGEEQHGGADCWIANALDEKGNIVEGDRYIIGHQELVDTYAIDFS